MFFFYAQIFNLSYQKSCLKKKSHRPRQRTIQNNTAKSYPVFEISKIETKSEECAQEISFYFICFTQQMKVIINCGKSDILKSKQVVSLAKQISNKFFQCLQSSPPASTRSLQLPFVCFCKYVAFFLWAFAHMQMKAERVVDDCGHICYIVDSRWGGGFFCRGLRLNVIFWFGCTGCVSVPILQRFIFFVG